MPGKQYFKFSEIRKCGSAQQFGILSLWISERLRFTPSTKKGCLPGHRSIFFPLPSSASCSCQAVVCRPAPRVERCQSVFCLPDIAGWMLRGRWFGLESVVSTYHGILGWTPHIHWFQRRPLHPPDQYTCCVLPVLSPFSLPSISCFTASLPTISCYTVLPPFNFILTITPPFHFICIDFFFIHFFYQYDKVDINIEGCISNDKEIIKSPSSGDMIKILFEYL